MREDEACSDVQASFYHYWMMRQLFVLPEGFHAEKPPFIPRTGVEEFLRTTPIESLPDAMNSQQEHVSAGAVNSVAG
jgi:hypothetical protein